MLANTVISIKYLFLILGRELPVVPGLTVQVSKQLGTSAKLHWESPKDTRKEKWNYGIYFSKIPKALFDGMLSNFLETPYA